MKIAIVSAKDIDGGAARAAYRFHRALRDQGHESFMIVAHKKSDDFSVLKEKGRLWKIYLKLAAIIDALPLKFYKKKTAVFSINWVPDNLLKTIRDLEPDIVHLQWVGQGFLNIATVKKIGLPVVWTLHDMWPFTGGCHYSDGCNKYEELCGACPQLRSGNLNDLSRKVIKRKKRNWSHKNIFVVSPSSWLADCAKRSSLFSGNNISTIPYNIDAEVFKPLSSAMAREILNLPVDRKIVLFGAMSATSDPRKGFKHLLAALTDLDEGSEIDLLIYGSGSSEQSLGIKNKVHYAGVLNDDVSLALCYAAADVFVAPSIQDNLPLTVMESLACGTPVVAFSIGGMPDMIDHKGNGYLAQPFDDKDLANGIRWVLSNTEKAKLRENARTKILKENNPGLIVSRYLDLYRKVLKKNDGLSRNSNA